MKRTWKIALGVSLAVLPLVGAAAYAHEHKHEFMKARISAHVEQALDAIHATPPQRTAVHAAVDHVIATFEDNRGAHQSEMEQAFALFEADTLDQKAIAEHRAKHEAEMKKAGDAV